MPLRGLTPSLLFGFTIGRSNALLHFICSPLFPITLQVRWSDAFPKLIPKMAVKTPVTLIPDKSASTPPDSDIVVERMEMEGFLLVPSKI